MSYERQYHVVGEKWTAAKANHMEEGIAAVDEQVSQLSKDIGDGLSDTAKTLLITIMRNGVYSTDQSANITALENSLATGGGSGNTTYTITNKLTNVTSNNSATSVTANAAYTATLTVTDGYELDSVTITMGGIDVTANVYANGVVSISAVTGNVVITASAVGSESGGGPGTETDELPTDGLCDFFVMSNATVEMVANGSGGYNGSGGGYIVGGTAGTVNDASGTTANLTYYTDKTMEQNITVCVLTKCVNANGKNMFGWYPHLGGPANAAETRIRPTGYDADGNKVYGTQISITSDSAYNVLIMSCSENEFRYYLNEKLVYTVLASDIENFVRWDNTMQLRSGWAQSSCAAVAIYNKTLSEVEATEVTAYLKTLEVV